LLSQVTPADKGLSLLLVKLLGLLDKVLGGVVVRKYLLDLLLLLPLHLRFVGVSKELLLLPLPQLVQFHLSFIMVDVFLHLLCLLLQLLQGAEFLGRLLMSELQVKALSV
jgi:hypothetical protein